jgi:2-polyprenyl-6-methoxyphenol hydroxylase-like FAD-dependent oxidoreductase
VSKISTPRNGGDARPRAIIVGGSMSGLLCGLLLQRQGWSADIFERTETELSGRGAGLVTHNELFDVLKQAGLEPDAAKVGVSVAGRRVFGSDGRIVAQMNLPQVFTSWGHLYGLLRQALPPDCYHRGRNLIDIKETETSVTAYFADGSVETGDLLIGADGIFSTVRAKLLPDVRPKYVGYVAWRGLIQEADVSPETRDAVCDYFAFSLPPGEQMLGYPVAGKGERLEKGKRCFNFVWYRPAAADTVLRDLLTDVDGNEQKLSIPPNKIRPELIAALRSDAQRLLAPQFAEIVERTEQPFIQAIQDLTTPKMVIGRRSVILGDAAFVGRPHIGAGVTKAALDAADLVSSLSEESDLAKALAAFERKRLPYDMAVVRRAQELGAYMQAQILTEDERRNAELYRDPQVIMAETAVTSGIAA